MDPNWSETGDRYMLKLFRDHLFHQVLPSGAPWINLAHIVHSLNKVPEVCLFVCLCLSDSLFVCLSVCCSKLDVRSNEPVCLSSSDEQSLLVVSYSDISNCLGTAFHELLQPSEENPSSSLSSPSPPSSSSSARHTNTT